MEAARLAVGDEVEVEVRGGRMVVAPVRKVRGRYRIADLVREIPPGYRPSGEEWGEPVGGEAW